MRLARVLDISHEHDGAEMGKPVRAELVQRYLIDHGIGVALLNLLVELVREISQQGWGDIVRGCERDQSRDADPIAEGHLPRRDRYRDILIAGYKRGR